MITRVFNIFAYASLAAIVIMLGIDGIFFVIGGPGQTLSYQFWKFSLQYPLIPFLLGFLCGHLVWQYNPANIQPVSKK